MTDQRDHVRPVAGDDDDAWGDEENVRLVNTADEALPDRGASDAPEDDGGSSGAHVHRTGKRLTASETDFDVVRQKAFLVALAAPGTTDADVEESLDELALLVDTAGADVVGRSVQRRARVGARQVGGARCGHGQCVQVVARG